MTPGQATPSSHVDESSEQRQRRRARNDEASATTLPQTTTTTPAAAPPAPPDASFFPDLDALRRRAARTTMVERKNGVLWKRRDVFRNRWRPRWFALVPDQGVLTYYLLTQQPQQQQQPQPSATIEAPSSTTPVRQNGGTALTASPNRTTSMPYSTPPTTAGSSSSSALRNRATSWDSALSNVSEASVDYDVVPRGTIYLLGCTVKVNTSLSKPEDNLYAFTIRSPSDAQIHLAAQSPDVRAAWVEQIRRVCHLATPAAATGGRRRQRPSAIPEGSEAEDLSEEELNGLLDGLAVRGGGEEEEERRELFPEGTEPIAQQRSSWKSLGSDTSIFENVPESLQTNIQEKLQTYLNMADDVAGWKRLFDRPNGHAAYKRQDGEEGGGGRSVIKSTAVLQHPPQQVFAMIVDTGKRQDFETNVRAAERMRKVNAHTFLDYYAYSAVWPTSAREFAVATHWRVMGRRAAGDDGDENEGRAIVVCSFSCSDAAALKPVAPKHVRAHLFVSLYVIREIRRGDGDGDDRSCHLTRLLSFDLAGGLSQRLSDTMLQQQASLPAVLAEYLQRTPEPDERLRGPLTNEAVTANVIDRLPAVSSTSRAASDVTSMESIVVDADSSDLSTAVEQQQVPKGRPTFESQVFVLTAPVFLYRLVQLAGLPGAFPAFCVVAFLAVRQVVLWHLGIVVPHSQEEPTAAIGSVTCRFSVRLKGVLRYIENTREEREEFKKGSADVSVVHIVASAVARSLKKEKKLQRRRILLPWLLIDKVVDISSDPVDVSVSEGERVVTVKGADNQSVQDIADELDESETSSRELGQCLVISLPDSDGSDMEMSASIPDQSDVAVVAVIGGVRLERATPKGISFTPGGPPPRPVLSLSLTIRGQGPASVATCQRFANEVRKLLLYPEMCDG